MIELKNVNKDFFIKNKPVQALNEINLKVDKGEIYGIIGLSGAGKSTLLRTINLLERPDNGHVFVNNLDLTTLTEKQLLKARKKIGIIFQNFNLLSSLNVYGNIAELLKIHHYPKKEINSRVMELLKLVGLEDKVYAYPANLSGGQKQRVGIARALAINSEILLCDEATSALDPQTTESILQLLVDINKKFNLTIVLITHEMEVIKRVCDKVAVMDKGKIVESGNIINVFSNPQHSITKSFVKTIFNEELSFSTVNKSFKDSLIIKIIMREEHNTATLLEELKQQFNVSTFILSGTITAVKGNPLSILLLRINGPHLDIANAKNYIQNHVFYTEIISKPQLKNQGMSITS
ncbi:MULTISPECIES: methionine ABC transporter ATP-binding protein [Priestia]|jgi:D-methionine transport system ATP-binding protein|uniref:Methionine import ABC transporter, ATP-binding protein MetN n=15 Tax=Priestia TaxID=2800373 RepID=D5E196_PRIM1|nr:MULTISPECIES: methionine ABC transporter ATP-binding protein [Priestia]AVX07016.1 methionine ABC transporter ATP-binding protein [Bacillus sp. Y-01]KQU25405.1 methionine ABC transporter ATP-binding protein [Bacillus sp. Leaf75]MBZ5479578.1 methionine ABC transporter ATP-binding protein [Bacillus sp. T_4]MCJ7987430.1 methionine ABC transporter ATP-binding protein [Priestia sp. OVL9]MDH6656205.1 D-methionine transport system ATP-binding protein [Bacillus sp. PvP124]MDP9578094.1 D-methionine 